MANTTQTNTSVINGVDREKLFGTIDLIKAHQNCQIQIQDSHE